MTSFTSLYNLEVLFVEYFCVLRHFFFLVANLYVSFKQFPDSYFNGIAVPHAVMVSRRHCSCFNPFRGNYG